MSQIDSVRERKKRDKERRILAAARDLFRDQGFDVTTTRQIADRAAVGLATLFLYATDKRDLLFWVFIDDLTELRQAAFGNIPEDKPFPQQLSSIIQHFYVFFAKNRPLSRDLLREMTFYETGMHSTRFLDHKNQVIARFEHTVDRCKRTGSLPTSHDSELIARCIFYLQAAEIRVWLAGPDTSPETGVRRLDKLLNVFIAGLGPSEPSGARLRVVDSHDS